MTDLEKVIIHQLKWRVEALEQSLRQTDLALAILVACHGLTLGLLCWAVSL